MASSNTNNRIVKNTLVLYVRMIVVLFIGLYSSRVILQSLGVIDYGIYNVVGSLVVMFSYLDSALSLAVTRFYSYEIPHGMDKVNMVFNTSFLIQVAFSIIVFLLANTIGLWLVNYKMVIPENRIFAANIVYQISILTSIISILSVPFNASITSHEDMQIYALLSLVESILKLVVAFLISKSPFDRLIFYSFGLLFISTLLFLFKFLYCRRHYDSDRFRRVFSKQLFKKMFSFVGWNFLGATAGVSVGQGLNIVINIFFGPAVNAARGIAYQVQGAINQLVTNINMAVNPQIIKRYSLGEYESMFRLVFFSSKISTILLIIVSLPIIIDAHYVLELWLKEVPNDAVLFTRLMLIYMITVSLTYSVNMSAQASGKIKNMQIAESVIILLNIPIVLMFFYFGLPAYTSFLSMIFFSLLSFIVKLFILQASIGFPIKEYVLHVLCRIVFLTIFCIILYLAATRFPIFSFWNFVLKTMVYILPLLIFIWIFVFESNEKIIVFQLINRKLNDFLKSVKRF